MPAGLFSSRRRAYEGHSEYHILSAPTVDRLPAVIDRRQTIKFTADTAAGQTTAFQRRAIRAGDAARGRPVVS
jgi:hypothetical protein